MAKSLLSGFGVGFLTRVETLLQILVLQPGFSLTIETTYVLHPPGLSDLEHDGRVEDDDGDVRDHLHQHELGPEHVVHDVVRVHPKVGQGLKRRK